MQKLTFRHFSPLSKESIEAENYVEISSEERHNEEANLGNMPNNDFVSIDEHASHISLNETPQDETQMEKIEDRNYSPLSKDSIESENYVEISSAEHHNEEANLGSEPNDDSTPVEEQVRHIRSLEISNDEQVPNESEDELPSDKDETQMEKIEDRNNSPLSNDSVEPENREESPSIQERDEQHPESPSIQQSQFESNPEYYHEKEMDENLSHRFEETEKHARNISLVDTPREGQVRNESEDELRSDMDETQLEEHNSNNEFVKSDFPTQQSREESPIEKSEPFVQQSQEIVHSESEFNKDYIKPESPSIQSHHNNDIDSESEMTKSHYQTINNEEADEQDSSSLKNYRHEHRDSLAESESEPNIHYQTQSNNNFDLSQDQSIPTMEGESWKDSEEERPATEPVDENTG